MSKQKKGNYLNYIPTKVDTFSWDKDDSGIVTIYIENKKIFQRITQKLLGKPKVSQIHLERYGSFIWQQIDGSRSVMDIAELADKEFGEEIHPLYERIASYFDILERSGFVHMQSNK